MTTLLTPGLPFSVPGAGREGPGVALELLGGLRLWVEGQETHCGDRPLCLLAVLALDGPMSRERLADLLWDGPTARTLHNLRMALCKLRAALGEHAGLIESRGPVLALRPGALRVDALDLERLDGDALLGAWRGPLLEGRRCQGTERWLEWVEQTEARLLGVYVERLRAQARVRRPEFAPDFTPQRPSGHPTPEPPVPLIGRADLMERIARAAEQGQAVFLRGAAGLGKTALGAAVTRHFADRPVVPALSAAHDQTAPYATVRRVLEDIRRGLNLPEPKGSAASSDFLESYARRLLLECYQHPFVSFGDDIHHWDDFSTVMISSVSPRLIGFPQVVVNTLRPAETSASCKRSILRYVEAGRGVVIDVLPLRLEDVAELAAHFLPHVKDEQVAALRCASGGIPGLLLPLLERARRLGGVPGGWELPLGATGALYLRLDLLRPAERDLLRLAALSPAGLPDLSRCAEVLARPLGDLMDAVEVLEQQGLLITDGPLPGVVRGAVLGHMPPQVQAPLRARLREVPIRAVAPPEGPSEPAFN